MSDPLLSEPFLRRPPPRCLAPRPAPLEGVPPPRLQPSRWPVRAAFERWAAHLLVMRSKDEA